MSHRCVHPYGIIRVYKHSYDNQLIGIQCSNYGNFMVLRWYNLCSINAGNALPEMIDIKMKHFILLLSCQKHIVLTFLKPRVEQNKRTLLLWLTKYELFHIANNVQQNQLMQTHTHYTNYDSDEPGEIWNEYFAHNNKVRRLKLWKSFVCFDQYCFVNGLIQLTFLSSFS